MGTLKFFPQEADILDVTQAKNQVKEMTMEEAHDLLELKELITRLGLKDDRRQSARYNVAIVGKYRVTQGENGGAQGTCWLVDVSREGISVRIPDACFETGTVLDLELPMGSKTIGVSTRVVHVQPDGGQCIAGLRSTREGNDIIRQLFSTKTSKHHKLRH